MKKLLIAFVLSISVQITQAQYMPTIGARWCYWQLHPTGNLYLSNSVRIQAEKDTVIGDYTYLKMNAYTLDKLGNETYKSSYFLHDSAGYVYYLRNQVRGLLFNFNAQVNDSVAVSVYQGSSDSVYTVKVKVTAINTDSTGLKTYTLNQGLAITQRIINRVFVGDFLPVQMTTVLEGSSILRTYSDNTITTGDTSQPCAVSSYVSFFGTTAQWYYSLWRTDAQPGFFYRVLAQGDTSLAGKICKVVKVFDSYGQAIPGARFYMYELAKKVYIWKDNQFRLLYNFDAAVGDTVTAAVVYQPELRVFETHTLPGISEVRYRIKNIRVSNYRKLWDIEYLDSGWRFSDSITEGIGSWSGFFGGTYNQADSGITGNLRCYFNGTHGVNYGNASLCDRILSVSEAASTRRLKLYPNPAGDYVVLPEHVVGKVYHIYSMQGKLLEQGITGSGGVLNLNHLLKGTYIIRLPESAEHAMLVKE